MDRHVSDGGAFFCNASGEQRVLGGTMSLSLLRVAPWIAVLASATGLIAAEGPLTFTSERGVTIEFTETDAGWTWSALKPPTSNLPVGVADQGANVTTSMGSAWLERSWSFVAQEDPAKFVFEQSLPATGVKFRRVFSFGTAAHVLRIETWVQSLEGEVVLQRAGLLGLRVAGESFRETGGGPASFPLFGRDFFAGIEHVSGDARVDEEAAIQLSQWPNLTVFPDAWQLVAPVVVGWVEPTDDTLIASEGTRDAFLRYLDTVRIKPRDLELHTNTWWTLPLPFNEQDVLRDIEALKRGFYDRTGMFFDSFALDLGWSHPRSIWQINAQNFPQGFTRINERLGELGSRLGLWVSPGSAYPPGLDNHWLAANGYELTPAGAGSPGVACFALGNRYQAEFRDAIVQHARNYALRHVKLDYMAHGCDVPGHGHPIGPASLHSIFAGLADVLDSLRAVNPSMVLEPLCAGYPPSPWWTMKTPYVLGPFGDDVPPGRVPCPEWMDSLISARDIAYRSDQARWIMPTQALETIDVVMQSPGTFENLAVMAIGRGRWFISTYLKPDLMTPENWDFLAALVRWARANKQFLHHARPIGGRPEEREAYGYLFHTAEKDLYCARNPWIEERTIELPVNRNLAERRELRMIYPRRQTLAVLEPGAEPPKVPLAPYETVILETAPVTDAAITAIAEAPALDLEAEPPFAITTMAYNDSQERLMLDYWWNGNLTVPANAELCVLVEGDIEVENTIGAISISGSPVHGRTTGSFGQFFAASSSATEHWKWFIASLPPGRHTVEVALNVPLENARVGVFVRGIAAAHSDPAPDVAAPFPVFRSDQRGWSRTLAPLTAYPLVDLAEHGRHGY